MTAQIRQNRKVIPTSGGVAPVEMSVGATDISSGSMTDIEFDTESGSNPQFPFGYQAAADGWYRVTARCQWQPNSTGDRTLRVTLFGAEYATDNRRAIAGSDTTWNNIAFDDEFSAGDNIGIAVQQTSGGLLAVQHVWLTVTPL